MLSVRGPTLIGEPLAVCWPLWVFPHQGLARAVLLPVLSAVLGEACPLYVHFVSDPLPYCLTVTTASPVEREEREVKGQSFHLSFTDIKKGLTCVSVESGTSAPHIEGYLREMIVVLEMKSLKTGQYWLLFEKIKTEIQCWSNKSDNLRI